MKLPAADQASKSSASLVQALESLNAVICAYLLEFERNLEDPYRGLYVTSAEVRDTLGARRVAFQQPAPARALLLAEVGWNAAPETGGPGQGARLSSPWQRLLERGRLDWFEQAALLLCLAPEIDLRYERVCGFLHDDVARKRPSVDLALALFCSSFEERLERRRSLAPDAPLFHQGLIETCPAEPAQTFLATPLRVVSRVLDFVLDVPSATGLPAWCRFESTESAEDLRSEWLSGAPAQALRALEAAAGSAVVRLEGDDQLQRLEVARAVACARDLALLHIDLHGLVASQEPPEQALRRVRCERVLRDLLVYFDGAEALAAAPRWTRVLEQEWLSDSPCLVGGATRPERLAALPVLAVRVARPSPRSREQLWQREAGAGIDSDLAVLAARSSLGSSELVAASRTLAAQSRIKPPGAAELEEIVRRLAPPETSRLSTRVSTRYAWPDLVLPEESLVVLQELCQKVRFRSRVLDDWGFGAKSAGVRGVAAMFCGPSGTGKTMAASIIANELGLELQRIDISQLVSKYIGETEKNLAQLFGELDRTSSCLFFDEADAVFGKRTEVKDAHDRYANLETSYLLQRIEEFDGLVILATNLRNNVDSAFLRRLACVVNFPMPDLEQRRQLWRLSIPAAVPLGADLDLEFLAKSFALTGGHIRNIALGAAYLAAAEDGRLEMQHLVRAAWREFQKIGRSCTPRDFGAYQRLLAVGAGNTQPAGGNGHTGSAPHLQAEVS